MATKSSERRKIFILAGFFFPVAILQEDDSTISDHKTEIKMQTDHDSPPESSQSRRRPKHDNPERCGKRRGNPLLCTIKMPLELHIEYDKHNKNKVVVINIDASTQTMTVSYIKEDVKIFMKPTPVTSDDIVGPHAAETPGPPSMPTTPRKDADGNAEQKLSPKKILRLADTQTFNVVPTFEYLASGFVPVPIPSSTPNEQKEPIIKLSTGMSGIRVYSVESGDLVHTALHSPPMPSWDDPETTTQPRPVVPTIQNPSEGFVPVPIPSSTPNEQKEPIIKLSTGMSGIRVYSVESGDLVHTAHHSPPMPSWDDPETTTQPRPVVPTIQNPSEGFFSVSPPSSPANQQRERINEPSTGLSVAGTERYFPGDTLTTADQTESGYSAESAAHPSPLPADQNTAQGFVSVSSPSSPANQQRERIKEPSTGLSVPGTERYFPGDTLTTADQNPSQGFVSEPPPSSPNKEQKERIDSEPSAGLSGIGGSLVPGDSLATADQKDSVYSGESAAQPSPLPADQNTAQGLPSELSPRLTWKERAKMLKTSVKRAFSFVNKSPSKNQPETLQENAEEGLQRTSSVTRMESWAFVPKNKTVSPDLKNPSTSFASNTLVGKDGSEQPTKKKSKLPPIITITKLPPSSRLSTTRQISADCKPAHKTTKSSIFVPTRGSEHGLRTLSTSKLTSNIRAKVLTKNQQIDTEVLDALDPATLKDSAYCVPLQSCSAKLNFRSSKTQFRAGVSETQGSSGLGSLSMKPVKADHRGKSTLPQRKSSTSHVEQASVFASANPNATSGLQSMSPPSARGGKDTKIPMTARQRGMDYDRRHREMARRQADDDQGQENSQTTTQPCPGPQLTEETSGDPEQPVTGRRTLRPEGPAGSQRTTEPNQTRDRDGPGTGRASQGQGSLPTKVDHKDKSKLRQRKASTSPVARSGALATTSPKSAATPGSLPMKPVKADDHKRKSRLRELPVKPVKDGDNIRKSRLRQQKASPSPVGRSSTLRSANPSPTPAGSRPATATRPGTAPRPMSPATATRPGTAPRPMSPMTAPRPGTAPRPMSPTTAPRPMTAPRVVPKDRRESPMSARQRAYEYNNQNRWLDPQKMMKAQQETGQNQTPTKTSPLQKQAVDKPKTGQQLKNKSPRIAEQSCSFSTADQNPPGPVFESGSDAAGHEQAEESKTP